MYSSQFEYLLFNKKKLTTQILKYFYNLSFKYYIQYLAFSLNNFYIYLPIVPKTLLKYYIYKKNSWYIYLCILYLIIHWSLIFTNQPNKQTKTDKYMNESYEQVFLHIISLSLVKSFSSVSFSLSISINFFRLIASSLLHFWLQQQQVHLLSFLFFISSYFFFQISCFKHKFCVLSN
jgi:membrane-associated HD superfamily phosphohydrolase